MRRVHASIRTDDLLQLDDFCGRRESARNIEKPGAETERTIMHRLVNECLHARDLVAGCGTFGKPDDHLTH
jgi:hypothetical protein